MRESVCVLFYFIGNVLFMTISSSSKVSATSTLNAGISEDEQNRGNTRNGDVNPYERLRESPEVSENE